MHPHHDVLGPAGQRLDVGDGRAEALLPYPNLHGGSVGLAQCREQMRVIGHADMVSGLVAEACLGTLHDALAEGADPASGCHSRQYQTSAIADHIRMRVGKH